MKNTLFPFFAVRIGLNGDKSSLLENQYDKMCAYVVKMVSNFTPEIQTNRRIEAKERGKKWKNNRVKPQFKLDFRFFIVVFSILYRLEQMMYFCGFILLFSRIFCLYLNWVNYRLT